MKLFARAAVGFCLFFCMLCPMFAADDAAVARARMELNKIQGLVISGVLPPMRLQQAKDALADAEDEAVIRNTLFQRDVTVEQAENMVTIAAKRLERSQRAFDERQKLVDAGIVARSEMEELAASLDRARNEQEWARKRLEFARELEQLAKNEQEVMRQLAASNSGAFQGGGGLVQHFVGSNSFNVTEFPTIEKAFEKRFAHDLPISAMGETEVHKALGFDHRNRVDIALTPDQPEGLWLRQYLTAHNIPFYAFRSAVPGKATGAHIHIGPPSTRYLASKPGSSPTRSGF
jgi:hypothetical protein